MLHEEQPSNCWSHGADGIGDGSSWLPSPCAGFPASKYYGTSVPGAINCCKSCPRWLQMNDGGIGRAICSIAEKSAPIARPFASGFAKLSATWDVVPVSRTMSASA